MSSPARLHAVRLLASLDSGGATLSDRLADPELDALPSRERALLHELVLGTLRRRGALDAALAPLVERPVAALDATTRAALRMGAHQILHLRVPDHAAVSESVAAVGRRASRGLVNAVLRRLAREGAPEAPDPAGDPLGWLTSAGSLPAWLAHRWLARLGPATALARARALLEEPVTTFRFNPRLDAAERAAAEDELHPNTTALPGVWSTGLAAEAGRRARVAQVYLQDLGSIAVARLAEGRAGRRVLDACAAPGGKTLVMADESPGRIVAAESSPRRLSTLARLVSAWGAPGVAVVGADASRPPFRVRFDTVLLDAPCSGLGTLGRRPDLRWRGGRDTPARHAARQARLLDALAPVVAPGGRLVYAVCSLEPEETDQVVDAWLERTPGFAPEPVPGWAADFADGSFLRTRPERDGCDGFFAAVLRRD